ncbi:hypothetical protein [Deinococcus sp.]|uniref:hypothetical protein n=1 Tax=Deinococcus sp. TaxID=47478 RepID=UPI0025DD1027|nr:hypothetical protein [Deinococcus sp.]
MEKRRENLKQLDTAAGRGVTFTTYQSPVQPHDLYEAQSFYAADRMGMRPNVLETSSTGAARCCNPAPFSSAGAACGCSRSAARRVHRAWPTRATRAAAGWVGWAACWAARRG